METGMVAGRFSRGNSRRVHAINRVAPADIVRDDFRELMSSSIVIWKTDLPRRSLGKNNCSQRHARYPKDCRYIC